MAQAPALQRGAPPAHARWVLGQAHERRRVRFALCQLNGGKQLPRVLVSNQDTYNAGAKRGHRTGKSALGERLGECVPAWGRCVCSEYPVFPSLRWVLRACQACPKGFARAKASCLPRGMEVAPGGLGCPLRAFPGEGGALTTPPSCLHLSVYGGDQYFEGVFNLGVERPCGLEVS